MQLTIKEHLNMILRRLHALIALVALTTCTATAVQTGCQGGWFTVDLEARTSMKVSLSILTPAG